MKNILSIAVVLNAAYIAAFPTASIFYVLMMLLHLALSLALLIAFRQTRPAAWLLLASAIPGLYLVWEGSTIANRPWRYAHVALAAAVILALCFKLRSL